MEQIIKTKAPRAHRKDRSNGKYSETDFLNLPREEQLKLAEHYWMGRTEDFDDGTFQFSYTHFAELCKMLGFRKGVVDELKSNNNCTSLKKKIYIEHGRREETDVKKLTLSVSTINNLDMLLGNRLSNIEKSKVMDIIIAEKVDELLKIKKEGEFSVAYRRCEEERLI